MYVNPELTSRTCRNPGLSGSVYFVGITSPGTPVSLVAGNHSPRFQIDEAGLLPALRATVHLAFDYMTTTAK